jgi:hypothetical protein
VYESETNMDDNLARDIDHSSDAPSTTERVGESNIGRTEWRERPQGFEGTAREAPIERDPRESIREDITDAIEEVGDSEEPRQSRRERRRDRAVQRGAQETVDPDQSQDTDRQTEAPVNRREAPKSWSREAKAEWGALSPRLQQEIHKREADMGRGAGAVHEENRQMKQNVEVFARQHQQVYGEIDNAIRPYAQVISNFNKTPGQAVGQLFAWFDALAKNPDEAFPALIKSYKYNPDRMLAGYGYYRQPQSPQQQQQTYQQQLVQRVNAIEQAHQQQQAYQQQQAEAYQRQQEQINAEATDRMLAQWAEDRPHFNEVRELMGHLLTPDSTGRAAVPLTPDGRVDLDTAYEMAVNAAIAPRQRQAAEQFQKKADRARRTATSLTNSAPGRNNNGSRQRDS